MNPTTLSLLSALAAAAWSIWTWSSDREKERQMKRDEMSALFIANFLMSANELQKLLYRILEEDELERARKENGKTRGQASSFAIDVLFHFSMFFGWGLFTLRYGSYTRDPRIMAIMARISEVLECRHNFSGEAFRFTISDRHALAHAVVEKIGESSSRPMFATLTRFKFEQEVNEEKTDHALLFQSKVVRATLAAVDRAHSPKDLEGRERLEALQTLLVDLCNYMERREGFAVVTMPRKRAGRPEMLLQSITPESGDVAILHRVGGRVRLSIPRLKKDLVWAPKLQKRLATLDHVESVRVNPSAACAVISYSARVSDEALIAAAISEVEDEIHARFNNGKASVVRETVERVQSNGKKPTKTTKRSYASKRK